MSDDTYTITMDRVPFPGEPPIKETRAIGTGMARETRGWMMFTPIEVPVPPTTEPWYDTVEQRSTRHVHDASCLEPAEGSPRYATEGTIITPEPGWYVCVKAGKLPLYVHDHGDLGYAHHMTDGWIGGCPSVEDDLPW